MSAPGHRDGFTLIEMLVLIIIMAVLATVVVPAYSRFRARAEFDARVSELTGYLAAVRLAAIESAQDVEVEFDPQTETFVALSEEGDETGDRPSALQDVVSVAPAQVERTFELDDSFAITDMEVFGGELGPSGGMVAGNAVFSFHPDGTSDGVRFNLRHIEGRSVTITVWPGTAVAEVVSEGQG